MLLSWICTPVATAVIVLNKDRYRRWECVYADSVPTAPYPRLARAFFESAEFSLPSIVRKRGQTSSHILLVMKLPTYVASASTNSADALTTKGSWSANRFRT